MADKKGTAWSQIQSERPPGSTYNLLTGEYSDKPLDYRGGGRNKEKWEYDRELQLYVNKRPDGKVQFSADDKGQGKVFLEQVIQDNPDRARSILDISRQRGWTNFEGGTLDYFERVLPKKTSLLGVDREKGLLTYA